MYNCVICIDVLYYMCINNWLLVELNLILLHVHMSTVLTVCVCVLRNVECVLWNLEPDGSRRVVYCSDEINGSGFGSVHNIL